ncbi:redoxin family protein, partial [Vibrio alginolyticus]
TLSELTADGMVNHDVTELFANKKVVLFAVPGAFTPTVTKLNVEEPKEFEASKAETILAAL